MIKSEKLIEELNKVLFEGSFDKIITMDEVASSDNEAGKFIVKIKRAVNKIFPNSLVHANLSLSGFSPAIMVSFTLGKDKSEYREGSASNDPAHVAFMINGVDGDGNLDDRLVLERILGGGFMVHPAPGSYVAMDIHKIPFRKTTGSQDRILKSLERYFTRLRAELRDNEDKIYDYNLMNKF